MWRPKRGDAVQFVHPFRRARQPVAPGPAIAGAMPGLGLKLGKQLWPAYIASRVMFGVARSGPTIPAACQLVPEVRWLRSSTSTSSAPRLAR